MQNYFILVVDPQFSPPLYIQDALKFVVFIISLFLNKDRPTQAIYKPRSRPRGDADDSGARNPGTFIYTRFLKIVILAYVNVCTRHDCCLLFADKYC